MRRFFILASAAVLAIVGYGMVAHHSSARADLTLPDTSFSQAAMQEHFTHVGDPGQDRPFLPGGKPAVSRQDAIAAVTAQRLNGLTGLRVVAKYGLFSNPYEQQRNPDGSLSLVYQNRPVWAVRVDGLHIGAPLPPDEHGAQGAGPVIDHFVYLVDAQTGEVLDGFSG